MEEAKERAKVLEEEGKEDKPWGPAENVSVLSVDRAQNTSGVPHAII